MMEGALHSYRSSRGGLDIDAVRRMVSAVLDEDDCTALNAATNPSSL